MSRKPNPRVDHTIDVALERLEYVTGYCETPDFVEVTGDIGGDTVKLRVYDDDEVYER